jgi:hypothetical protein
LLLPATLISSHAAFAVNLLLQLAGFFIFRDLLGRLGIRRAWAILYLFYPPLVLYSRTVMSEVPSAMLLLLALDLYARSGRNWRIAAGALLGLLGVFRYANPIPATLLIAGAFAADVAHGGLRKIVQHPLRREARAVPLLVGFVPAALLVVLLDVHLYGSPLGASGYAGAFSLKYVPKHLALYAIDLAFFWPLMVFAPLLYRGRMWREATIATYGTLLIISAWYYVDDAHGLAENAVTIPRLLLPVIPVWLVTYAGALDRLFAAAAHRRVVISLAGVAAVGLAIGVSVEHQRHVHQAESVRSYIEAHMLPGSSLLINPESTVFVGPAWGTPRFVIVGKPQMATLRCPAGPLTVIYTGNGESADAASFQMTQSAGRSLGATPAGSGVIGPWTVSLWTRRSCPS